MIFSPNQNQPMRKVLAITTCIMSLSVFGQNVELSENQLSASIFPAGFTYEKKIDDSKSFTLGAGMIPSVVVETRTIASNSTTETYVFFQPYIASSFRNYYTRNSVKKSNLKENSGNYIGLLYSHWFKPLGTTDNFFEQKFRDERTNLFTVGPVWGIERNYASGIHLDLSIGVGYQDSEFLERGEVTIIGQFEFGFVLFSK